MEREVNLSLSFIGNGSFERRRADCLVSCPSLISNITRVSLIRSEECLIIDTSV